FNSYIWVIDAHPEDIAMVDYVKPDGEKVMRTIADFRQLNDALFHAGTDSGSSCEWEDTPNRLHFYVIDVRRDKDGILSYTLAVRSLDGAGPQRRGVALASPGRLNSKLSSTPLVFDLKNTGQAAAADPALHPSGAAAGGALDHDVYRLSARAEGKGWEVSLPNSLAAVEFGGTAFVTVYAVHAQGSSRSVKITLSATSESDPSKTASATIELFR
ncbi:MAG TPA: peptidase M6, partial [Acidobacteriota bacterium]|nr:peptidase M6 [Acidobacteriota bacterium]